MIDYEKIIQNSVNVNKSKGRKESSNLKKKGQLRWWECTLLRKDNPERIAIQLTQLANTRWSTLLVVWEMQMRETDHNCFPFWLTTMSVYRMALWLKTHATKTDSLCLIPKTYPCCKERTDLTSVLWTLHKWLNK